MNGILPRALNLLIDNICPVDPFCNKTTVYFNRSGSADPAEKPSEHDVKLSITTKSHQLSFFTLGSRSNDPDLFIPVKTAHQSVLLQLNDTGIQPTMKIKTLVMNTVPVLIFMAVSSLLAGIVIWLLVSIIDQKRYTSIKYYQLSLACAFCNW